MWEGGAKMGGEGWAVEEELAEEGGVIDRVDSLSLEAHKWLLSYLNREGRS